MAVKLSKFAPQNPWWRHRSWWDRDKDLKGIDVLLDRKTIAIIQGKTTIFRGIRRSGKTVFLKLLIKKLISEGVDGKDILYLSCDRHSQNEVRAIVNEFSMRREKLYLILDEITYLDDWNILIKEIHETMKPTIVATGSNPVGIKGRSERLPGRGIEGNEYYFNPLSFGEYVRDLIRIVDRIDDEHIKKAVTECKNVPDINFRPESSQVDDIFQFYEPLEKLFISYIFTGGFPDASRDYMRHGNISDQTYEGLIRLILGGFSKEGRNEDIGRRTLEKLLDLRLSRVDYKSIAEDVDVHHNTVKEYLDLLEDMRVVYSLSCWDLARKRHATRKQKKILFQNPAIPSALYKYLTGCNWDDVSDFVDRNIEWLVEGTISSHIIWAYEKPLMKEKFSFAGYWYGKRECDLVIRKQDVFFGFESKYGRVKRGKYPFETLILSKDELEENIIPASLFLFGLKKGSHCI